MTAPLVPNAVPKNVQWWGVGRELTSGTIALPVISIPLDAGAPIDQVNMLTDKGLRGTMAEDYNLVAGTEIGAFQMSGDVYLDAMGHVLYNLFGEYQATGSATGSSTTTTAALTTSSTSVSTTASLASGTTVVQIGTGSGTSPAEILTGTTSGTTFTFTTGTYPRFDHASGAAITAVSTTAPYTHTFKLLNPSGATAVGLPFNSQPVTHTITHYNGLAAAEQARQYAYWCTSGVDFTMDTNNLFQHNTKGSSFLGADASDSPSNIQQAIPPIAAWRFQVSLGGAVSSSSYVIENAEQASISIMRQLAVKYAMANTQNPVIIGRLGLSSTGRMTLIAQDESPLLNFLAGNISAVSNATHQLQVAMSYTNPVSGIENGITFNFQQALFEAAQLGDPDMMTYDVSWRGLANTTDAGITGGLSPVTVTVINQTPTY